MSKIFSVIVATSDDYLERSRAIPDHQARQGAWFAQNAKEGKLIACGPFMPRDGTGLWLVRAASLDEAKEIVATSPRATDGMLAEGKTRIVEWDVAIGQARFE